MNHEMNSAEKELHALELKISHFLRGGVLAAGVFLLIGWVWLLFKNGEIFKDLKEYHPQPFWESLQWNLIMNDRASFVLSLGLVILVSLPIIRVLMTGVLFIKQKDFKLAIMAFLVFAVLLSSFFLGIDL